jgi:hypothetical protein
MLGSRFHAVMKAANRGQIRTGAERITRANQLFGPKAHQLFAEARPLIRAKFASPEKVFLLFSKTCTRGFSCGASIGWTALYSRTRFE